MIWQVFILGFSGYLVLGNINLGIFELSADKKYTSLLLLVAAAVGAEFLYAWLLLGSMHYMHQNELISFLLSVAVFLVFLVLGVWNLVHKPTDDATHRSSLIKRAVLAIVVHPQQVPYWIIWGSFFAGQGLDLSDNHAVLTVSFMNAAGASLSLGLFALLGSKMIYFSRKYRLLLGRITGVICLGLALSEAIRWFV